MDGPLKSFGVSNPDFVHLRVAIHNTLPNHTKNRENSFENLDFFYYGHLQALLDFLSAIFGIFGNFRIDIDNIFFGETFFSRPKNFLEEKITFWFLIFVQKNQIFDFFIIEFFDEFWFFSTKNQNQKFIFFFEIFFGLEKKVSQKKVIYVNPKIAKPKIALRKACNEHKYSKNADSESWNKKFHFFFVLIDILGTPAWRIRCTAQIVG